MEKFSEGKKKALSKREETWKRSAKKTIWGFYTLRKKKKNKQTKVTLIYLKEHSLGWTELSFGSGDCPPPLSPFRNHYEWEEVGWPCFLK
jgi:hypothetical protein